MNNNNVAEPRPGFQELSNAAEEIDIEAIEQSFAVLVPIGERCMQRWLLMLIADGKPFFGHNRWDVTGSSLLYG